MVGAISPVGSWGVARVWGAHATNRRGPTPLIPVEAPTASLPVQRLITYQLRPDGRVEMRPRRLGHVFERSG